MRVMCERLRCARLRSCAILPVRVRGGVSANDARTVIRFSASSLSCVFSLLCFVPFLNYSRALGESVTHSLPPQQHPIKATHPDASPLPLCWIQLKKRGEIKKMPAARRGWCFSEKCRFVLLMAASFGNHYGTRSNQWSCISILVVDK